MKKKLVIMGSNSGRNLEAVVNYLRGSDSVDIEIEALSDNLNSEFLQKSSELNIRHRYLPPEENAGYLGAGDFDLIALSGYSRELKPNILELGRFINIHPSLLPAFKGTDAIARAFGAGVKVSGVTVHTLTNEVDGGKIVAQYPVLIGNLTHFDEFEEQIRQLEDILYPIVILKILEDKVFDFQDLLGGCGGNCSGECSGCGRH